ncbi:MAG: cobyric acid synthase [Sphingomonadales bacterium]
MFQGTGSDVGKSLVVTGLCRALANRGYCVRPFKPQNMSNNAAVTADGGEIGRAQHLQALAARAEPTVDMNPVLLKPQSDRESQVVVHGRVKGVLAAREFGDGRQNFLKPVLDSFGRLAAEADIVVAEGAGSPAEINLRQGDIANMGFARAAEVPVVLIGDIDRGGVIANLVGAHVVLDPADRAMVHGFLINKFRGDVSLFDDGLAGIAARTGWPDFGVLPFLPIAAKLPAEDAVALERYRRSADHNKIRIAVPMLSRISNFDDFDPLQAEPDVSVIMAPPGQPLPGDADAIILPGSKAVIADLNFMRDQGWDIDLAAHVRRGGRVLGICGGYQMLGRRISDGQAIEGPATTADGLGLLNIETALTQGKTLEQVSGLCVTTGEPVSGYEMHMGETAGPDCSRPMLLIETDDGKHLSGAISGDRLVQGCYLHGLFASDRFRHAFLNGIRERRPSTLSYNDSIGGALDELAGQFEHHLDIDGLLGLARAPRGVF